MSNETLPYVHFRGVECHEITGMLAKITRRLLTASSNVVQCPSRVTIWPNPPPPGLRSRVMTHLYTTMHHSHDHHHPCRAHAAAERPVYKPLYWWWVSCPNSRYIFPCIPGIYRTYIAENCAISRDHIVSHITRLCRAYSAMYCAILDIVRVLRRSRYIAGYE